jgi:hypothetical protein
MPAIASTQQATVKPRSRIFRRRSPWGSPGKSTLLSQCDIGNNLAHIAASVAKWAAAHRPGILVQRQHFLRHRAVRLKAAWWNWQG